MQEITTMMNQENPVYHAWNHSWNQPVQSNEGKIKLWNKQVFAHVNHARINSWKQL